MKYQDGVSVSMCPEPIVDRASESVNEECDALALFVTFISEDMSGYSEDRLRERFCWIVILADLGLDVSPFVSEFLGPVCHYEDDEDFGFIVARIKEAVGKDMDNGVPGRWFY